MTTFSTRSDFVIAQGPLMDIAPTASAGAMQHLDNAVKALGSHLSRGSPFASASVSALSAPPRLPGGLSQRAVTLEPKSGMEFPNQFCHLSKRECPNLIGTGVRSKKLVGIKNVDVYALGFYVDVQAAKRELDRDFGCLPPASLERNQALADRLKDAAGVEKSVRIVITSGMVSQGRFSKGLRESLEPRVRKTGDAAALDEFEGMFAGARFHRGTELVFTNTRANALALRIDGADVRVGQVASPGFTCAFFDLYLGPDPVSKDGKASIAKGLARAISRAGS